MNWEYLGHCTYCNASMWFNEDTEELRTDTDTACICELDQDDDERDGR